MTEKDLINAAIRGHCGAWWETYGRIWAKDRTKGLVVPKQNYLQHKIQRVVDHFEELELPCRVIGLKPRARGSTTYFTALGYTAMRRSSTSAVFIGGQSDQTVGLWNMLKTYHKNDAFDWKNTGEVNEKGATFSNGSRAKKETAKDVQAGIGDTYQHLHATEAARWSQYGVSNAAAVMSNLLKAVPLLAGTSIFLESTAENAGGDYYNRWLNAVDSDDFLSGEKEVGFGSYVRCFAAWFQFEESALRLTEEQKANIRNTLDSDEEFQGEKELLELYGQTGDDGVLRLGEAVVNYDAYEQLAWRRYAIREECDRDLAIFNRDFPPSWREAFMKSGNMRFNSTGVAMLRKRPTKVPMHGLIEESKGGRVAWRNTEPNEAKFTIWEKPINGCRYIIPVDPMTGASQAVGLDPDKHSVPVMRAGYWNQGGIWVRKAVVARIVPCRWEIDMLEESIWRLSRFYGSRSGCMIAIEMNMDRGLTELLKLRGANLYVREVLNKREMKTTSALGYLTNTKTRETLITTLASDIREWDTPGAGIDIWCPHILEQIENFILKETGRSEAGQGFHDDDCIVPGTLVRCERGMVPIEDVVVGDKVLTHLGRFMPVTRTVSRPTEKIFKIKSRGKMAIEVTGNHPLLLAKRQANTWSDGMKTGVWLIHDLPEWLSVDSGIDLTSYASLTTFPKAVKDYPVIDLFSFCPPSYANESGFLVSRTYNRSRLNPTANKIKAELNTDAGFCFMMGYYAAEGAVGAHSVCFASHAREKPIRDYVSGYLRSLGLKPSERHTGGNGWQLNVASMPLRNFFRTMGTSADKSLPAWTAFLPPEKQRQIIIGYFLGDGCFSDGSAKATSISPTLSTQIHEMLMRNGMPATLRKRFSTAGRSFPGRTTVSKSKPLYDININPTATKVMWGWIPKELQLAKLYRPREVSCDQTNVRFCWDSLAGKILSVEESAYSGKTHCIDVAEDHSFHANGVIVHNCLAVALGSELIDHATIYMAERNIFGPPRDLHEPPGGSSGLAFS